MLDVSVGPGFRAEILGSGLVTGVWAGSPLCRFTVAGVDAFPELLTTDPDEWLGNIVVVCVVLSRLSVVAGD